MLSNKSNLLIQQTHTKKYIIKKLLIAIFSLLLSTGIFCSFLLRNTRFLMYPTTDKIQTLLVFFFVILPFLSFFIYYISEFLINRFFSIKNKFIFLGICFTVSLIGISIIFRVPYYPIPYSLTISPVIDKNEISTNKNVVIDSILILNEPTKSVQRLIGANLIGIENWTVLNNSESFSYSTSTFFHNPSLDNSLSYYKYIQGGLKIIFQTSNESLNAIIKLNDSQKEISLFSIEPGKKEIDLSIPPSFANADWIRKSLFCFLFLSELFALTVILLFLFIFFSKILPSGFFQIRGLGTIILVISTSLLLVFAINSLDKEVEFADPNLEKAIRNLIENQDKPILFQQLQTISYLDLSNKGVKSLEGIGNLRNLIELHADYNQISDLSPLSPLKNLSVLSLNHNHLQNLNNANIQSISGLPIKKLFLSDNVIRNESLFSEKLSDISPLGAFLSLQELDLQDNDITNISVIDKLQNLKSLNLERNEISLLPDLCNLQKLKSLNLRDNQLTSIDSISCLSSLEVLNLQSNINIINLDPLQRLTNLSKLNLENIKVANQLYVISGLTKLKYLNLTNSNLGDINPLVQLFSAGILQDNSEQQIQATLMLRNNPDILQNEASLEIINKYWANISNRDPITLPQVNLTTQPPQFSHLGGLYEDSFDLSLSVDNSDLIIIYTMDGSEPTIEGINSTIPYQKTNRYQELISIKNRIGDKNLFSTIPTKTINGEFKPYWLPPKNEVFKATVIRARTYDVLSNKYSKVVTNTYFIDDNISQRYTTLPIISLSANYQDLFDPKFGIYTPATPSSDPRIPYIYSNRRVPANIEFFDLGGKMGFNGIYEISLQGGTSRSNPQKGLNVVVNEWFGEKEINYPIFSNSQVATTEQTQFYRFILRSWGSSRDSLLFSDAYHQTLLANADIEIQDYQPVIVFINGEYWGLHEIRQAIKNVDYFSQKTNTDPNKPGFDIINLDSTVADDGDSMKWNALVDFIQNTDLSIDANYDYVSSQIDIDNFITYIIHCTFTGKRDWPEQNEGVWNIRSSDGKWRWFQFDMDQGLSSQFHPTDDMLARILLGGDSPHPIFNALLANQDFRTQFINTYADFLNSYFLTQVELSHFANMVSEIEPYMPEYQDRWQLNMNWENDKIFAIDTITNRAELRLSQLMRNFNLENKYWITLVTNPSEGQIKINSIIINNSLPGISNPSSWSGTYFNNIPITVTAIPVSGYHFDHWESNMNIDNQSAQIQFILENNEKLIAVFKKD